MQKLTVVRYENKANYMCKPEEALKRVISDFQSSSADAQLLSRNRIPGAPQLHVTKHVQASFQNNGRMYVSGRKNPLKDESLIQSHS